MRAAYFALVLGVVGGLGLATAVLSDAADVPVTVAAALDLSIDASIDQRRSVAVALLTTDCMRRLGLAWTTVPEPVPTVPDGELGPVAWADRWGFGISTAESQPSTTGMLDPNMAAVEAMSAASQSTYRAALHGVAGRPGCHETASAAVYGLRERLLTPLRPSLDRLEADVASDPALVRALGRWHACVAGVSAGAMIDRRSLPGALVERFAARISAVSDSRELAAVQADERRVAGVIARCEVAFAEARTALAAPHEARFVAGHLDALRSIGDAIRSAESALPTVPPP